MPTTPRQSRPADPPSREEVAELVRFFRRNGYIRRQNRKRLAKETYNGYKKGDELRLIALDPAELLQIQNLLQKAGFKIGKPFAKGSLHCQPVYGRAAVARFLKMVARFLKTVARHERAAARRRPKGK